MSIKTADIHRELSSLLVAGLAGTRLTDGERRLLEEAPPAGLILFGRNVESAGQLRKLTGDITSVVTEASGLPPLIMADHEGGRISVLAEAIGAPPSQMAAWRPGSGELLAEIVSRTARQMMECGFNLTLSPVADVNSEPNNPVIGTRSFGESADVVSPAVRIAVKAIAGEGMLSCLKHFPGHGATALDSHVTLPVTGRSIEQIREEELPPFIAGIEEGADMVMTAHIAQTGEDPPASLDPRIVTDLLRGILSFEGVVITDALEMAGAGSEAPVTIAASAIEAGNDLLLMSRPIEEVYAEVSSFSAALETGLDACRRAGLVGLHSARIRSIRERMIPGGIVGGHVGREGIMPDGIASAASSFEADMIVSTAGLERLATVSLPLSPVFLGYQSDFESPVVSRFIGRVLDGLGRGRFSHIERDGDGSIKYAPGPGGTGSLVPVEGLQDDAAGLFLLDPGGKTGSGRALLLLCRRPLPGELVGRMSVEYEFVVAAEGPWDVSLLDPGIPVAVTYGTYDAAADRVAELLKGRP
jgi:beta-N-acetylhexosaminidase